MARIMCGFGCTIVAHDPERNPELEALGGRYASLDVPQPQRSPEMPYVTLRIQLTVHPIHIDRELGRMRPADTRGGAIMQSIDQNWIWIVVAIAILAFFFLQRGRRHGGFSGGHGHGGRARLGGFEHGGFGGFGHDGLGHYGHRHRGNGDGAQSASAPPVEAAIDPVSGSAIPTAGAITSVYQGKAYFFASKENRDRFEAAPQDFAGKVQGLPIRDSENIDEPRHRHHGC